VVSLREMRAIPLIEKQRKKKKKKSKPFGTSISVPDCSGVTMRRTQIPPAEEADAKADSTKRSRDSHYTSTFSTGGYSFDIDTCKLIYSP
jgi:hypothetical protein